MKVFKVVAGLFLATFLLTGMTAAQEKKATTVDELAKMYDVSSCKQCHPKQFEEWAKSIHARSLIGTGRTMATIKTAIQDGMMKEWAKSGIKEVKDIKVDHMLHCLKCHLPQLKNATDAVAQQIAKAVIDGDTATLEKVNINCIICHNQKALIHKYVDGEPEANVIYGSKEGAHGDKMFTALKKSPIMKESIICGQCHGLGPNFELANPTQCATLYGSYLHNYTASAGVVAETCQDCHMTKHKTGHVMPGYRDPAIAKSAVDVEVTAKGYHVLFKAGEHIPTAAVQVKMTSNAGHRIPDG
ncbi:MAG: cytochrome C [Nitrospirae bacterium]|nr:cytochrome C [Nitrospirota bacterium]NTW65906.1 cytochrome C [Nitrospirota bacterium]